MEGISGMKLRRAAEKYKSRKKTVMERCERQTDRPVKQRSKNGGAPGSDTKVTAS
jgi:hypothetical protein